MYIEYVIIDNLIIDYLLLKTTMVSSRVKTSKLRLFLSSVIGTIVAVIMPFFKMSNGFLILLKLNLALIMVIISGEFLSLKKILISYGFFLAFTFLFGGILIGVFYLADVDYVLYFSINYDSFMPVGISVLIVYVGAKFTIYLVKNLLKSRDIEPFIRPCAIIVNGKKYKLNGYIDSGNRLFDKSSGLPIVVISKRMFDKINSQESKLFLKSSMVIDTVNGISVMQIYVLDKLLIYNGERENIINNVMIGKSEFNFESDGNYDLLLNPSIL